MTIGLGKGQSFSNTVVGTAAFAGNTSGNYNVSIGYIALANNTIGGYNTAV